MSQSTFKRKAHIAYFTRCLTALPAQAQGHDSNRITIAYFCLSGLSLLNALKEKTSEEERDGWTEWVWGLQAPDGGFRGSTYMTPVEAIASSSASSENPAHLPSSYTALLVLALLKADLSRLNATGLLDFLARCQEADGSFSPLPIHPSEKDRPSSFQSDARMAYCASAILSILNSAKFPRDVGRDLFEHGEVRLDDLRKWIGKCQTWEGGYGASPGLEAQGGTTYCSLTAKHLLFFSLSKNHENQTLRWLINRQVSEGEGGFQGRPGKDEDVCYSFWCGAAIRLLAQEAMFDIAANKQALLNAQSPLGGFGKTQGDYPDPFHSYLAIAALAMLDAEESGSSGDIAVEGSLSAACDLGLKPLDAAWNVDVETKAWLVREMQRVMAKRDMDISKMTS